MPIIISNNQKEFIEEELNREEHPEDEQVDNGVVAEKEDVIVNQEKVAVEVEEEVVEEEDDDDSEVEDDEDFIDEKENVATNAIKVALQQQSLAKDKREKKLSNNRSKSTAKLVDEAIKQLNEKGGSSVDAIKKFIMNQYPDTSEPRLRMQIKRYLTNCVTDGTMAQIKRSFKLTNKHAIKMKEKVEAKKGKKADKEKEKKKTQNIAKAVEKKSAKKEKPIEKSTKKPNEKPKETSKDKPKEKLKDSPKPSKKPKEAHAESKAESSNPLKLEKVVKSTKSTETKRIEEPKTQNKLRKPVNAVLKPASPRVKTMKSSKAIPAAEKEEVVDTAFKNKHIASTLAPIKTGVRAKRK